MRRRYWDRRYADVGSTGVSWYQRTPTTSLALIERLGIPTSAPVVDVGGGASFLVDELLLRGYTDVSVLDVSATALEIAQLRLDNAASVHWLCEDITTWQPERRYVLWHDRAVFHFLTDAAGRTAYLDVMNAALADDGMLIIAAFAADGPEHCSGLPVARYGPAELAGLLDGFMVVESLREMHVTPAGDTQPFTWIAARRRRARDL